MKKKQTVNRPRTKKAPSRKRAATKKRPLRRKVTRHRTVTKGPHRPGGRARVPLYVLTANGVQELPVKGRKDATLVGKHWNAVRAYVVRGESAGLGQFDGLQVTDAEGDGFRLLTDVVAIEHLANAGVLSFETIYARTR